MSEENKDEDNNAQLVVGVAQTISYIGSKRALVTKIVGILNETWSDLTTYVLVDAFFGSGSFFMGAIGSFERGIVNDYELYSVCIACALVRKPPLLAYTYVPPPRAGFIHREYSADFYSDKSVRPDGGQVRMFFSADNGARIDGYRAEIALTPDGPERRAALGDLMVACDAVANTMGTYGAFSKGAREIRDGVVGSVPCKGSAKTLCVRPISAWTEATPWRPVNVTQGDALDVARQAPHNSVLYLDPPYVQRGYGCNYFVLNVIADVDREPVLRGKTGIPRYEDEASYTRSLWNSREGSIESLRKILNTTPATRVAMSYSTDGLMKRGEITDLFVAAGWTVREHSFEHPRYNAGKSNPKGLYELLFVGERRKIQGVNL